MGIFTTGSRPLRLTLIAAISVGGWRVLRWVWPLIFAVALVAVGQYVYVRWIL
jgi:hypothetical protein